MDKVSTSDRLKYFMNITGLKQKDILNKAKPFCKKYNIKLEKNDLSQYVSGKVEPGQKKLSILSKALNVNPAWLMGFDAPIENDNSIDFELNILSNKVNISSEEISNIYYGIEKLPAPMKLIKIANELDDNPIDYLSKVGYINLRSKNDEILYNTGVRYLLNNEERKDLCDFLNDRFNQDNSKSYNDIYNMFFYEEKEHYSKLEIKLIIEKSNGFKDFENFNRIFNK